MGLNSNTFYCNIELFIKKSLKEINEYFFHNQAPCATWTPSFCEGVSMVGLRVWVLV